MFRIKKPLFVILLCFFMALLSASIASGQIFYPANEKTIAWDAVTTVVDADGNDFPISATDVIKYKVLLASYDGSQIGTPQVLGITTNTNYVVTLSDEGKYVVGVSALRYLSPSDEESISESTITWSHLPEGVEGEPFGLVLFYPLKFPIGLRIQ
jgi:hypothetical protein